MRLLCIFTVLVFSSCLTPATERVVQPGMIHTVAFTMAEGEEAGAADLVGELERELTPLPGVVALYAGLRAEQYTRLTNNQNFQVLLVIAFRDTRAHDEYEMHPIHRRLVERWAPKLAAIEILDAVR
jgi:hypothetical protein